MDENVRGSMREVQFFFVLSGALGGGSEPEKTSWMGGGALLAPNRGGSFEKLAVRLLSMSYAFISLNPGLWSPLTVETKEESSRVAS